MAHDVPLGCAPDEYDDLISGTCSHLPWRVAGLYANVSIFDVQDAEELHQILMGLPLYPFMAIKVEALCRHPSSIRDDDR
ncbi:muconolactone Delta-isomerase family protein [Klebsiella pneumoniae]